MHTRSRHQGWKPQKWTGKDLYKVQQPSQSIEKNSTKNTTTQKATKAKPKHNQAKQPTQTKQTSNLKMIGGPVQKTSDEGEVITLYQLRYWYGRKQVFIALLFPWTSFCFPEFLTLNVFLFPEFLIYVYQSRICASGSLLAALNSWCISMHALLGLLRSLRCLFPCVLVVSCASFVSCIVYLYPEVHYYEGPHSSHPKCLNAKLFGSHFCAQFRHGCASGRGSAQLRAAVAGTLLGTCLAARGTTLTHMCHLWTQAR